MRDLDLHFLVGHSITAIKSLDTKADTVEYSIVLDNGDEYKIETNEGCGACVNGWSDVIGLEELPLENVVTNVDLKEDEADEDLYEIFVFFHNDKFDVKVNDGYGNGYYGGGFKITINGKVQ